ncbi:MAG: DUF2334 domain-containing protein [Actinomycetota bacterium]
MAPPEDTIVFFRDDDLVELDDATRHVATVLADADVPVNYQLIPAAIPDDAVADLIALRRAAPDLVRYNQHGWRHEATVNGASTPAEFSGHPDPADQRDWIGAGKGRLADLLGEAHDPRVFTPPNHAYDATTLEVLASQGFDIISAGFRPSWQARAVYAAGRLLGRVDVGGRAISRHTRRGPSGLRELSVSVNVDMDQLGARVTRDSADLIAQFEAARAATDVVGVMLHHQCWVPSERDAKTDAIEEFVAHLRSEGCRFLTIEAVADHLHDETGS